MKTLNEWLVYDRFEWKLTVPPEVFWLALQQRIPAGSEWSSSWRRAGIYGTFRAPEDFVLYPHFLVRRNCCRGELHCRIESDPATGDAWLRVEARMASGTGALLVILPIFWFGFLIGMLVQQLWLPAVLVFFFPLWVLVVLHIGRHLAQEELVKARMKLGVTVAAINAGEECGGDHVR